MAGTAAAALSSVQTSRHDGPALQDVSLAVLPGEVLTLLGAAGSGKTTVLRVLAGFARPSSGQVCVAGRDAGLLPPRRRGLALVEHGLGLFADMTVAQALAFADPSGRHVAGLLEAAGLVGAARLRPAALSAGQRARLAVARALAASPHALLLDEPASGLDRRDMDALFALVRFARARGPGILYATSDPEQAIVLGDRMAVLAGGAVRQTGVPQALYDEPADPVVATLTGPVNVLAGEVQAVAEDGIRVRLDVGALVEARAGDAAARYGFRPGGRCVVCVRPERVAVAAIPADQMGEGAVAAEIAWVAFHGSHLRLGLRVGNAGVVASRPAGTSLRGIAAGRMVSVAWQPHHATAFRTIAGQA